jgi:hypothetical protein
MIIGKSLNRLLSKLNGCGGGPGGGGGGGTSGGHASGRSAGSAAGGSLGGNVGYGGGFDGNVGGGGTSGGQASGRSAGSAQGGSLGGNVGFSEGFSGDAGIVSTPSAHMTGTNVVSTPSPNMTGTMSPIDAAINMGFVAQPSIDGISVPDSVSDPDAALAAFDAQAQTLGVAPSISTSIDRSTGISIMSGQPVTDPDNVDYSGMTTQGQRTAAYGEALASQRDRDAAVRGRGSSEVASGDPTAGGFGSLVQGGSIGEGGQSLEDSFVLGEEIETQAKLDNITYAQANASLKGIGEQNKGIKGWAGETAANYSAAMHGIPQPVKGVFQALGYLGPLVGMASALTSLGGQGMLADGSVDNTFGFTGVKDAAPVPLDEEGLGGDPPYIKPRTQAPSSVSATTDGSTGLPTVDNTDPFAPTGEDEDLTSWYDSLTADYRRGVTWASMRTGKMSDPNVYTPTLY